jgi:methionine synthase I (cobalamin-dependent)
MIQVHEGASAPLFETLQQMHQAKAAREATLKRAET